MKEIDSSEGTTKEIKRRELMKLAGAISAFGIVLGFSSSEAGAAPVDIIRFKLYKGEKLLHTHQFPRIVAQEIIRGEQLRWKLYRNNNLISSQDI
jgi:hypothetical protein